MEENIVSMALHRGKLYYSVDIVKDESNGVYESSLKEYDLFKLRSEPKEILKFEKTMASIQEIIPIGSRLIYTKFEGEGNNLIYGYYVYDLNDKAEYKVGEDITDENLGVVSIFNKMIMFIPRTIEDNKVILDSNVYVNNLNSPQSEVLFKRSFDDIIYYSDNKYVYVDNVATLDIDDNNRILTVYNKEGNKVDSIDVTGVNVFFNFVGGDEKYIFVRYEDEQGSYIKYIDKSKIGTGTAKLETLFELESKYLDSAVSK